MTQSRESIPAGEDADREREICADRKFSLGEAIGRMAGAGALKGESPITRQRQAELMIQDHLCRHLTDPGGVLGGVLLRHVADYLFRDYDHPTRRPDCDLGRDVPPTGAADPRARRPPCQAGKETGRD
jgi:hypothetical protein